MLSKTLLSLISAFTVTNQQLPHCSRFSGHQEGNWDDEMLQELGMLTDELVHETAEDGRDVVAGGVLVVTKEVYDLNAAGTAGATVVLILRENLCEEDRQEGLALVGSPRDPEYARRG